MKNFLIYFYLFIIFILQISCKKPIKCKENPTYVFDSLYFTKIDTSILYYYNSLKFNFLVEAHTNDDCYMSTEYCDLHYDSIVVILLNDYNNYAANDTINNLFKVNYMVPNSTIGSSFDSLPLFLSQNPKVRSFQLILRVPPYNSSTFRAKFHFKLDNGLIYNFITPNIQIIP